MVSYSSAPNRQMQRMNSDPNTGCHRVAKPHGPPLGLSSWPLGLGAVAETVIESDSSWPGRLTTSGPGILTAVW